MKKIIDQLIGAFESRDIESLQSILADDVSFENVAENKVINGRLSVCEVLSNFFDKTTSIQWDVHRKIFNEHYIAIERTSKICYQGNNIEIRAVAMIEIKKNKIISFSDYFDAQTFIRQNNNETWT